MKSKRSKKCDISIKVKKTVWERDNHRCIFCGSTIAMPNAHVRPRSAGGLGVEQNIVTACFNCHNKMDASTERKKYLSFAKAYLNRHYGEIKEEDIKYAKCY